MIQYNYTFDPKTRTLTPSGDPVNVKGDTNVVQIVFTMPASYEGLALSSYVWRVFYNIAMNTKLEEVRFHQFTNPTTEGENLVLTWTVTNSVTEFAGHLGFALSGTLTDTGGNVTNRINSIPAYERIEPTIGGGSYTEDDAEIEGIKDFLVGIQEAAEAAQAAAETAAAEAEASAARAEQIADELEPYKALAIVESASGDPASFADGASNVPMKSVSVGIEPVQDLHGYEYPWVGGAGKNLFDEEYTNISANITYKAVLVGDGTFVMSSTTPLSQGASQLFFLSGNVSSGASSGTNGVSNGVPRTATSSGGYVTVAYRSSPGVSPVDYKTQIEKGTTPTAWTPYSNICPISGWGEVKVTRTGKNLLDLDAYVVNTNFNRSTGAKTATGVAVTATSADGYTVPTGGKTREASIKLPPNTDKITISANITSTSTTTASGYIYEYDEDGVLIGNSHGLGALRTGTYRKAYAIVSTDCKYVYLRIGSSVSGVTVTYSNLMIMAGDVTTTDYEPYASQTYPISLTSAGTVYGGTLDVVTGKLVIDRANIVSYNGETLPSTWMSDRDKYIEGAVPTIGAQVVYKLATPQSYALTPTQITSLFGTNHIWADCGEVSVEYVADTKMYIDKIVASL